MRRRRHWRAGMSSTTLAVTPIHARRLTGRGKTDRTAEAATLETLDRAAHDEFSGLGLGVS